MYKSDMLTGKGCIRAGCCSKGKGIIGAGYESKRSLNKDLIPCWWLSKIMPEILTTSSRTAINSLLRFFSFCSFIFLFSFIMTHCKYYFEILFHVTFVFICK